MVSPLWEDNFQSSNLSDPYVLLATLQELRQTVEREGLVTFEQWQSHIQRSDFSIEKDSSITGASFLVVLMEILAISLPFL